MRILEFQPIKGSGMHMHRIGARAQKAWCAGVVVVGLLYAWAPGPASAQTAPGAGTSGDVAPSEAARRQALGPFRMILQNANAPARAKPAVPAETKRPAAHPPHEASAVAALAPSVPPAAPASVPAAPPPEPAAPLPTPMAAVAPRPAEPLPAPVHKALVAIKQDAPELTGALLRQHAAGTVKVAFDVNPDGSTSGVKVLSSTNHRLDTVSIEAVAGWRFQPLDEIRPTEVELVFSLQ